MSALCMAPPCVKQARVAGRSKAQVWTRPSEMAYASFFISTQHLKAWCLQCAQGMGWTPQQRLQRAAAQKDLVCVPVCLCMCVVYLGKITCMSVHLGCDERMNRSARLPCLTQRNLHLSSQISRLDARSQEIFAVSSIVHLRI